MALVEHAERELREAGLFDEDSDYEGMLGEGVMELVRTFAAQGHSGYSAQCTIDLFRRVASYQLLNPMKNPMTSKEYHEVGEGTYQPARAASLVRTAGKLGTTLTRKFRAGNDGSEFGAFTSSSGPRLGPAKGENGQRRSGTRGQSFCYMPTHA